MVSLLEGCGLVTKIARVRLISAIAMTIATWSVLTLGGGLLAAPAAALAEFLTTACWLVSTKRNVILQLWRGTSEPGDFSWKKEIWPLQWRAAVSFASSYLMFQVFNPLLFHFRGPEEAGRMGMSHNLVWAALTIALSWINTKAAPFGDLIAQQRWRDLDRIFFQTFFQSLTVLLLCCFGLLAVVIGLERYHIEYSNRLLDPQAFALLLFATVGTHVWCSYIVYLRAHKKDPFVLLTLLSGSFIVVGSTIVVGHHGALGLVAIYAAVTWIIGVGYGSLLFFKLRRRWHAQNHLKIAET